MSDKGWDGFGTTVGSIVGERLSSPLISTFAISWSLWNFKFFVILLSDNTITTTYALIEAHCFPNAYMSLFNGLVAPATLTIFYLYYLPKPLMMAFEQWSKTQKETKDIKQRWEDQNLLGHADAQELRQNLRMAQSKLEDSDTEIRKLKAELRQSDLKSSETQEALRIAETNFRKSSDELRVANAALDEARNDAGGTKEQLSNTKKMFESERNRADQLEGVLKTLDRPKKIETAMESLLLEVAKGQITADTWETGTTAGDEARLAESTAILQRGFVRTAANLDGKKTLAITAAGLRYLIVYGLIDGPQLEFAIHNYRSKPGAAMEIEPNNWNELLNRSRTSSSDHANALAKALATPVVSPSAALEALASTNKFTNAEMNALAAKLKKP